MTQDVILDVKNKRGVSLLFLVSSFFYISIKKKEEFKKSEREKNSKSSTETEREGFEPSVRMTRTTD